MDNIVCIVTVRMRLNDFPKRDTCVWNRERETSMYIKRDRSYNEYRVAKTHRMP